MDGKCCPQTSHLHIRFCLTLKLFYQLESFLVGKFARISSKTDCKFVYIPLLINDLLNVAYDFVLFESNEELPAPPHKLYF